MACKFRTTTVHPREATHSLVPLETLGSSLADSGKALWRSCSSNPSPYLVDCHKETHKEWIQIRQCKCKTLKGKGDTNEETIKNEYLRIQPNS